MIIADVRSVRRTLVLALRDNVGVRATRGFVIAEDTVPARREPGDTAAVRVTIDASSGSEKLEQQVIRFAPGRSRPRGRNGFQELLYVAEGQGDVEVDGERHPVEPGSGVYVGAGECYVVENQGPDSVVVVSAILPAESASTGGRTRHVRYHDRPALPAGGDREFRYLVDRDAGCLDATQFVGIVQPGRAPTHGHVYDEVIYVLEGEGVLHVDGASTSIGRGSCIHLPPLDAHCLENSGSAPLRLVAVFHPAGDPASRAYDET